MKQKIDSYYIDMNGTLHTFIGENEHISVRGVDTDERAQEVIAQLNIEL